MKVDVPLNKESKPNYAVYFRIYFILQIQKMMKLFGAQVMKMKMCLQSSLFKEVNLSYKKKCDVKFWLHQLVLLGQQNSVRGRLLFLDINIGQKWLPIWALNIIA